MSKARNQRRRAKKKIEKLVANLTPNQAKQLEADLKERANA